MPSFDPLEDFAGRGEQIRAFEKLLKRRSPKWVMLVQGISGTGKSLLVDWLRENRCQEIANAKINLSPSLRALDFLHRLASQLDRDISESYAKRIAGLDAEAQRNSLVNLTYAPTTTMKASLGGSVRDASQSGEFNLNLGEYAATAERDKRERHLEALDASLSPLSDQVWVLFLDESENLSNPGLSNFIFDELIPRLHAGFPGFRLYLTGQETPQSTFAPHEKLFFQLDSFTQAETTKLLQKLGVDDQEAQRTLYEFSSGHPLLVGMVLEDLSWRGGGFALQDFRDAIADLDETARTQWIYDRVIARFQNPTARQTAADLALFEWFDLGLLRAIYGVEISAAAFQEMIAWAFVKSMEMGRWRCHDAIRKLLKPQRMDLDPQAGRETYASAFEAYNQRLASEIEKTGQPYFNGRLEYVTAALSSIVEVSAKQAEDYLLKEIAAGISDLQDVYLYTLSRYCEQADLPETLDENTRRLKAALADLSLRRWSKESVVFIEQLGDHAANNDETGLASSLYYGGARIAGQIGLTTLAVELSQKAVSAEDGAANLALLVESTLLAGDLRSAADILAEAQENYSDAVELRTAAAELTLRQGQREEAIEQLTKVILDFPKQNANARMILAELLIEDEAYEQALKQIDAVLEQDPGDERAQSYHDDLMIQLGRVEEFLEDLSQRGTMQAHLLDTSLVDSVLSDRGAYNRLINGVLENPETTARIPALLAAEVAAHHGDLDNLQKVTALINKNWPDLKWLCDTKLAIGYFKNNQLEPAAKLLQGVVNSPAPPIDSFAMLSEYHVIKGEFDQARRVLRSLLDHQPWAQDLVDQMIASTYFREKRPDAALEYLDSIEEERVIGPYAKIARAEGLFQLGRNKEAREILELLVYTEDPSTLNQAAMIKVRSFLAGLLIRLDEPDQALELGQQLLTNFGDSSKAIHEACTIYAMLGKEEELRRDAASLGRTSYATEAQIRTTLASLLLQRNHSTDGLLDELKAYPERLEIIIALDQYLTGQGKTQDLNAAIAQAEEIAPGLMSTYYRLQKEILAQFGPSQVQAFRQALEENPENAILRLALARTLQNLGDYAQARTEYITLRERNPKYAELGLAGEAQMLIEIGELQEAERLLLPFGSGDQTPKNLIQTWRYLLQAKEDYAALIALNENVAERFPELRLAALELNADIYNDQEDYAKSLKIIAQIGAEKGDLPPSMRVTQAVALVGQGESDRARAILREVAEMPGIAPDLSILAYATLGDILRQDGDLNGAEQAYRQAIRVDKRVARPYFGLALILRERKAWSEAYETLQTAVSQEPGSLSEVETTMRELHEKAEAANEAIG